MPNNKNADTSPWDVIADDNLNMAHMMEFAFDMLENIVEKRENADYQHFLLFKKYLQKTYSAGSLKVRIVWYGVRKTLQQQQIRLFV